MSDIYKIPDNYALSISRQRRLIKMYNDQL